MIRFLPGEIMWAIKSNNKTQSTNKAATIYGESNNQFVLTPNQTKNLSELGLRALIAGTIASLFTAVIIGMIM